MKYVKGIIGGLIGGLIASIPWILVYVYGNMLLSILAFIIAYGVNFGYRFFKGEVDKHLPTIITVSSLLIVVVVTLVIIPLLLLYKEGYYANFANLQILYADSTYMSAVLKDLLISILFTILGISGIVKQVKEEVSPVE